MMTFDQIMNSYAAYLGSRETPEVVEWTEKEEKDDDRGSKGETE